MEASLGVLDKRNCESEEIGHNGRPSSMCVIEVAQDVTSSIMSGRQDMQYGRRWQCFNAGQSCSYGHNCPCLHHRKMMQ